MSDFISSKSPAKLNFFLNIKKKKSDGFHEIDTILEKISLFDDIKISVISAGINIKTEGFKIPEDDSNIAYKAADLFVSETNIRKGVEIYIKKRIPPGGGLGGGSGNAALVLKLMNNLFEVGLGKKDLIAMAKKIGTDVPFFICDYAFAIGSDKGDEIKEINTDLLFWHLLINPGLKISTSKAYKLFDSKYSNILTKNIHDVRLLIQDLEYNKADKVCGKMYNSFERPIFTKLKKLLTIKKELLKAGAKNALLTGSGSNIYGVFLEKKGAIEAEKKLSKDKKFPYVVYGPFQTCI